MSDVINLFGRKPSEKKTDPEKKPSSFASFAERNEAIKKRLEEERKKKNKKSSEELPN